MRGYSFSKAYLPSLSDGAFDDPRLNLVIADGADFIVESVDKFDVIIIDSTDPIGRARPYLLIIFTAMQKTI